MDSVQTFLKDCLANQLDALYESVLRTVTKAGVESFEDLKSAISKLERGERPTPAERRQIVRIVVAELLETVPAPRKSQLEPIAKEIVGKYPRPFSDYTGDFVIGGGHSSLLCQLIARVENCRRVSSTQLKRSLSTGQKGPEKVSATAKYGCTDYQPNFPEGESPETQIVKRATLVEEWKMETRNASVVDSLMDNAYPLQRLDVNKKTPLGTK
ncbi:hypothetical protein AVEN_41617-1 [Araneus ventricosus]|uniref:Uncharacterized protein n=1 Tax=Araneus ventricosus TaxID=182803 RepID=A0A4Y2HZ29_ARAVE|nr:hypothetical protein AVEN_41617-1 [Araneus ventricosus]